MRSLFSVLFKSALAGSLLVAAACSPDISAPGAEVKGSGAQLGAKGRGVRNSVKYRAKGKKPGAGRTGSATLEFRALLGADGRTVLEATTGTFEGTVARGNIDKVQLKLPKTKGSSSSQNFNGLKAGGYWTYTVPAPAPSDGIQIQAHVSGIDKKTNVVTATAVVWRRPDVAVNAVHAPPAVPAGMPVTITADVVELNGDIGARANCVLSVNGAVVDQANGMWVDAGGVVSCAFNRSFEGQGSHEIVVSVTGVTPGDWNTANNSATTTIVVPGPGLEFTSGYLSAYQFEVSGVNSVDRTAPVAAHTTNTEILKYSTVYMSANASGANAQDAVGTLLASISVDGNEVGAFVLPLTDRTHTNDGVIIEDCASYGDMGRWASICRQALVADPSVRTTSANFQHIAGTITYYGHEYYCEFFGACDTYTWNDHYVYSGGDWYNFQVGQTVSVSLTYVGSSGSSQSLNRSVILEDRSAEIFRDSSVCGTDVSLGFNYCYEDHRTGTFVFGAKTW